MKTELLRILLLNRWSALLHDLLWVPLAIVLAYWLRFNLDNIPAEYHLRLYILIAIAVPVQGAIFWHSGLYRGMWRFASIPDLMRIFKAIVLGTMIIVGISSLHSRLIGIPRSVFFLYPLLLAAGLCTSRISYRWYKDHRLIPRAKEGKRTVIVGAGRAGEMLARDLLHRPEYQPLVFVDDDPLKHSREIHGIRVSCGTDQLAEVVKALSIELVLLAIPSADKAVLQRLINQCNAIDVQCQTLPSIFEMGGMPVNAEKLRPVTVEDLLGREVVRLDQRAIADYLSGKIVLVTGGGGSIGTELCRQIAGHNPAKIIILEHGEYNLYLVDQLLRVESAGVRVEAVLGDIKNSERVDWVFRTFRPQVVFHAAAYKHVPMLEDNPAEGVANNVAGTKVVADAADRYQVDRFVLVSTDKAVNPANVMGATKRVAELYCQNLDKYSKTCFITTRFGNVLGSTGSVVPLFRKQIAAGGPVTVTHPEITRYFMTIPESVSLILQAGSMGGGGEIFVLDMGEPVTIRKLAEQMIRLSGLEPDKDIKIVYTGLRAGEKLFEEMLHDGEKLGSTGHPKLFLASSRCCDWQWLNKELERLSSAVSSRNVPEIKTGLQRLVPEYKGK